MIDKSKTSQFRTPLRSRQSQGDARLRRSVCEDGLRLASMNRYDAAVVDVMLPQMDGLSLIEKLRQSVISTPIIVLSTKRSFDERTADYKFDTFNRRLADNFQRLYDFRLVLKSEAQIERAVAGDFGELGLGSV